MSGIDLSTWLRKSVLERSQLVQLRHALVWPDATGKQTVRPDFHLQWGIQNGDPVVASGQRFTGLRWSQLAMFCHEKLVSDHPDWLLVIASVQPCYPRYSRYPLATVYLEPNPTTSAIAHRLWAELGYSEETDLAGYP